MSDEHNEDLAAESQVEEPEIPEVELDDLDDTVDLNLKELDQAGELELKDPKLLPENDVKRRLKQGPTG